MTLEMRAIEGTVLSVLICLGAGVGMFAQSTADSARTPSAPNLSAAYRTYKLQEISGSTGANTLFDCVQYDRVWIATASENVGGMREGYALEVTDEDRARLNSVALTLNADGTVSLACSGSVLLSLPLDPTDRPYEPLSSEGGTPADVTLIASAYFPPEVLSCLDFFGLGADTLALLVDTHDSAIELVFSTSECCSEFVCTFR